MLVGVLATVLTIIPFVGADLYLRCRVDHCFCSVW